MPGFERTAINSGNFSSRITLKNGGQIKLWKSDSSTYPTWVITFQPNGELVATAFNDVGEQISSGIVGTYNGLAPNEPASFYIDGCGHTLSIYNAKDYSKIAELTNSDTASVAWIEGVDTGNPSWEIQSTVEPKGMFCSSNQISQNLFGVAADTEATPWWIWLMVALAGFFILLVLIFGGLALTAHHRMKRSRSSFQSLSENPMVTS